MDLDGVRALFESIPWVRHAEVRRLWPDRLEVRLEEQVALARWGQPEDGRLVNVHGEVFNGTTEATLPLFAGPSGTALEVAQHYDAFRSALAPLELAPVAVVLSPRFSWQVRLSNGLTLQLGRDADRGGSGMSERLARFVGIYPGTVAPMARRVDYADLRYGNGFALHVPGVDRASGVKAASKPASKAGRHGGTTRTAQGAGGAAKGKTKAETPAARGSAGRTAAGDAGGGTRDGIRDGTQA
ncbi:MAG TPA: cell division protein FtsQ/DivIB, partial [Burkholderiales bacterium]|nr:cell division protein FtsQ/DivIB [Burkholderiales bacterium]